MGCAGRGAPGLWLLPTLAVMATGCGSGSGQVMPPNSVVREYGRALRTGDAEAAHGLLVEEGRSQVAAATLTELLESNRAELRDEGTALEGAAERPMSARAIVSLKNGEAVTLVLENGRWAVEGGVFDAPTLATPLEAVAALRRALLRRSLRGLERVLARQPRAEIESEIDELVEETTDGLDLEIETQGNRTARVRTSSGREIDLVREAGEWRILQIR